MPLDATDPLDELGIARAMAAGQLPSPQKYENLWLFSIRITGTGMAYRSGIDEHVWRDPSLYLNDEFLARCNGLSVIWVHPEDAVLNHQEFADRIIGSVFIPFIKGEDVWAVVKIYDENAAKEMSSEQLSTSPTVVFRDPSVNSTIKTEDGKTILVEGKPSLLDHIAIVPLGVWDKSGPPKGVLTHGLIERADSMSETLEEKKAREEREDAARRDAASHMDKMSAHMDAQAKIMDAFSKRMDAMEMADKARRDSEEKEKEEKKDAARKDAKKRRDSEREAWAKEDAEGCAKDDAEEEAECDKMKKDGEDDEDAAEKAREARKDRMSKRKDAAAADAKAKADAIKADAARADADSKDRIAALTATNDLLSRNLANMPKSPNDPDYGTMADAQFKADGAYQAFGKQAPPPMSGETVVGYRRRLADGLRAHSPDWKSIDLQGISADVLDLAEKKIYSDAVIASRSSEDIAEGIFVPRKRVTESGHHVIEYRGRTTIFKQFSSAPLYATKFLTNERGA